METRDEDRPLLCTSDPGRRGVVVQRRLRTAPEGRPKLTSQAFEAGRERAERRLFEYAASRDSRIRSELIAHYDWLAISSVRAVGTRRDTFEDLLQVARIGLLHAVDRFDPSRERPFVAFARATISGELKRHLRDSTWRIRPPRSLQEHHLSVVRAVDDLTQELGRSPRIAEVSHRTGLDDEQVLEAMDVAHANAVMSLERPYQEDVGHDIGEECSSFAEVDDALLVRRLLAYLPERDREIIRLRFEQGMTQAQIGEILGLSQMSISRTLARALGRLRSALMMHQAAAT